MTALEALSPLDGRYAAQCAELRALFSEAALIRHRVRIEAAWFEFLARELALPELAGCAPTVIAAAQSLAAGAAPDEAAAVKAHELRIAHDVKAVEYHVRARLELVRPAGGTLRVAPASRNRWRCSPPTG